MRRRPTSAPWSSSPFVGSCPSPSIRPCDRPRSARAGARATFAPAFRRPCGFTLIEVLVVVTILGILLAAAAPNFAGYLARQRVVTATNDLFHAFAMTRAEALRRGRRVMIAPVAGHWHNGWIIFVDRNDDRLFDAAVDELIAQHDALPPSVVVSNPASARESFTDLGSPPRPYVQYEGSGYARQRNGGFAAGSVALADRSASQVTVRTICLASLGRVRVVERGSCS